MYWQYRLIDVDCDFVIDFCVVCLVKTHRPLISSSAKEHKKKEHKIQQSLVFKVFR